MVRLGESHYQKYDYVCSMPITLLQVSTLWDIHYNELQDYTFGN